MEKTFSENGAFQKIALMINPAKFSVGVVTSWKILGVVISLSMGTM